MSVGSHNIEVKLSGGSGRGLFAKHDFVKGEEIEVSPVLPLDASAADALAETTLSNYIYDWLDGSAVALGYGSLFNHSEAPNVHYHALTGANVIVFKALRFIEAGEELLVSYTDSPIYFYGDAWESEPREEGDTCVTKKSEGTGKLIIDKWCLTLQGVCALSKRVESLRRRKKVSYSRATDFFKWAARRNRKHARFLDLINNQRYVDKLWEEYARLPGKNKARNVQVVFKIWHRFDIEYDIEETE